MQCACEYFQKLCIWTGKGIPCFGRLRFPDLTLEPRQFFHTKTKRLSVQTSGRSVFFFLHVAIRNSLRSNKCFLRAWQCYVHTSIYIKTRKKKLSVHGLKVEILTNHRQPTRRTGQSCTASPFEGPRFVPPDRGWSCEPSGRRRQGHHCCFFFNAADILERKVSGHGKNGGRDMPASYHATCCLEA